MFRIHSGFIEDSFGIHTKRIHKAFRSHSQLMYCQSEFKKWQFAVRSSIRSELIHNSFRNNTELVPNSLKNQSELTHYSFRIQSVGIQNSFRLHGTLVQNSFGNPFRTRSESTRNSLRNHSELCQNSRIHSGMHSELIQSPFRTH